MLEQIREFWGYVFVTTPSGQSISAGQIASVVVLVIVGYLGSRLIGYLLGRRLATTNLRPDVVHILKRIAFFVLIVLVGITALGLLGIPLTAFAFATGAIAIGVGFGAQNILNNFISGWILMGERPIRIGDFVEVGDMLGTVESINTRFTRVLRLDGVRLMIPNSQLLENTVVNWTIVDQKLRSFVRVGVEYGSDVLLVKQLLDQILANNPDILEDPAPTVIFEDFGDSALIFDAYFWIEATEGRSLRGVRSTIRFEIDRVFKENDITIAFPQRDIHIDGSLKLENPGED